MAVEKSTSQMTQIPASSLRHLPARISYLSSFLSFQHSDGLAIQASKPLIAPLIPVALDLVYTKLLGYDITAKAFVPRQDGSRQGPAPTRPQDLHLSHSHILHRKNFLRAYLVKIVSNADWTPLSPLWRYMDVVGAAHAGGPLQRERTIQQRQGGQKDLSPALRVEYMQLSLLLGFVQDVIVGLVLEMEEIDARTKKEVILAWNKLLWIQNDLFARHYVVDEDTGERPRGSENKSSRAAVLGVGMLGLLLGVAATVGYGALL